MNDVKEVDTYKHVRDMSLSNGHSRHDLRAHWVGLLPDFKLWKFVGPDNQTNECQFDPILLIHGFHSDHQTWNYMATQLWHNGFRSVFAWEAHAYEMGITGNADLLDQVVEKILDITQEPFLHIIGHSIGGLVGRYFMYYYQNGQAVRLLATLGSPHKGLVKGLEWIGLFWIGEAAKQGSRDPTGLVAHLNDLPVTWADRHLFTKINIMGIQKKLGGTDGLFMPVSLPDMVNQVIPATHFEVNKCFSSFKFICEVLQNKSVLYKISLVDLQWLGGDPVPLYLRFRQPQPHTSILPLPEAFRENRSQRYPTEGFLESEQVVREQPIVYVGVNEPQIGRTCTDLPEVIVEVYQKKPLTDKLETGLDEVKKLTHTFDFKDLHNVREMVDLDRLREDHPRLFNPDLLAREFIQIRLGLSEPEKFPFQLEVDQRLLLVFESYSYLLGHTLNLSVQEGGS